ncbi:MAG: GNAT family N-acetyltransferase [Deltaproteobacteria bacterium]|nr:GNAT family N-acetyltransferase [Deltaproteobacteria bacterium]
MTNVESSVTVRIASAADLEALVRLAVAFRDHLTHVTPSEEAFRVSIAQLLQDTGVEFFVGCDDRGARLGYVQCRYRYSAWVSGLEAELEDVFVVPAARRRGVGRQLIEFALNRARENGCRSIGLNTNERKLEALALYRTFGFRSERPRWAGGRQLWLDRSLEAR